MDIRFYKLRLCGSDLILIDDLESEGRVGYWESAASLLLHRRKGVGAERLAVLSRSGADTWLRVFLSEPLDRSIAVAASGTTVAASGTTVPDETPYADALLCAARYLLDSGRSSSDSVRVRTPLGELSADVLDSASIGIALGAPRRAGVGAGHEEAALDQSAAARLATSIEAGGRLYQVLPLRAGLPGTDAVAVFSSENEKNFQARIADARGRPGIPAIKVHPIARNELGLRVKTQGALDLCSAAGIALAAASAVGACGEAAALRLDSGVVWVEWKPKGLYVAGRPEYVFRGEFHLDEKTGD